MNPIQFGILITSDRSSSGTRADLTGPALIEEIQIQGWNVVIIKIVPDDLHVIADTICAFVAQGNIDIILTSGGTGLSPRDVTPDATRAVIERDVPGLAEMMRSVSHKINPNALLSRAIAGVRGRVLIINLPGSPKGAVECLRVVMPCLSHAMELINEAPLSEEHHFIKR